MYDTANCRLLYVDAAGDYVCTRECPAGLVQAPGSTLCVPDTRRARRAVVGATMGLVCAAGLAVAGLSLLAVQLERRRPSGAALDRGLQRQAAGRQILLRSGVAAQPAGIVSASKDRGALRGPYL